MIKKTSPRAQVLLVPQLARGLGTRRAARLRSLMRETGLPPEALLDLALELLDIASRKLSPSPLKRTAVELGAARWRNVSPEVRSEVLRRASQARWNKHRRVPTPEGDKGEKS
jgi:hypothetical protein